MRTSKRCLVHVHEWTPCDRCEEVGRLKVAEERAAKAEAERDSLNEIRYLSHDAVRHAAHFRKKFHEAEAALALANQELELAQAVVDAVRSTGTFEASPALQAYNAYLRSAEEAGK